MIISKEKPYTNIKDYDYDSGYIDLSIFDENDLVVFGRNSKRYNQVYVSEYVDLHKDLFGKKSKCFFASLNQRGIDTVHQLIKDESVKCKIKIEISETGDVICYKVVDPEYKDIYTHTISNKVGEIVEMDRKLISDDRTQTCSYGLHAASLKYLRESGYGCSEKNHLMKIIVNPADFVSVPIDYDGAKARVCRYEVVDEIDINQILTDDPNKCDGYIYH